ncbi:MAG: tryptophan synthase beta subunit-like PLP-dependent enzyme [Monoraphidium minutum]|nr:MAG: tryptophan synthase beta subunit-like PLP-dependent enzyme [Monoraphidium minutum]
MSGAEAAPKRGGAAAAASVAPAAAPAVPVARAQAPGARTTPSLVVAPEDFTAPSGQLIPINVLRPPSPADGPAGCAAPELAWRREPDGYLKQILTARVYRIAVETPLQAAPMLSKALGNTVLLKREDMQPVRSFKVRGAYNKMSRLTPAQLEKGVGVALAARTLGCSAVICMPTNSPEIKIAAVRELGGTVQLVGESFYEAQVIAQEIAIAEGRTFVSAYDDPFTVAGQGTIGHEILRQTDMEDVDYIFAPIGGGGMIAGIAAIVKALKPSTQIIGVEPTGANSMTQSLVRGERITLSRVDAFADGVAIKLPGAEPFRLCRELLDGVVVVDNSAISTAIKDVFNETRSILEPAGAVAVAGAKAFAQHYGIEGKRMVAVTSGANMNFDRLRLVSELVDVGSLETMLAARIPDRHGGIVELLGMATDGQEGRLDVTELKYRFSGNEGRRGTARLLLGLGLVPGSRQCADLLARINGTEGFYATDISGMDLAQVHLRHMVGGPAVLEGGEMQDEVIFQVDYPELRGMLHKLLTPISPRWDITLLHFRKTGQRAATALLGVRVPPGEMGAFQEAVAGLNSEFVFRELAGRDLEVFKMFV